MLVLPALVALPHHFLRRITPRPRLVAAPTIRTRTQILDPRPRCHVASNIPSKSPAVSAKPATCPVGPTALVQFHRLSALRQPKLSGYPA